MEKTKKIKKSYKIIGIIIVVFIILLVGIGIWLYDKSNSNKNQEEVLKFINQVTYLCKDNKRIIASFYEKPVNTTPLPGEPPIPSGRVELALSDGRYLTLSQIISADGVRYANDDESFVFWSKGNGALVLENNEQKDFQNCIRIVKNPGGLPNAYLDAERGFTLRYPADYLVDSNYKYEGLGPDKQIEGVKFTIPESMATGTNLSSYDTGVSIEVIPTVENCNANLFLGSNIKAQTITDNDREYSFVSRTEGAAGNFYDEQVWAFSGTNYCIGVRYLIHYTNIENYPTGTISQFDKNALLEQFDKIRRSLIVL